MWNLTPINTWCRCFTDGMRCWIWVTFEVVGWYINIRGWMLFGQVYEIVDLTLLIDQIHPSTLSFGSSISVTKPWASPLTLQCAKDDLLFGYSHFSLTTISTNFLPCQYWHRSMILHIPNRWYLSTATTCRRHHGHWYTNTSGQMTKWYIRSQEFDVHNGLTPPIATCSVPVHYLLDWSSILVLPPSLLSSSAQDEEGNLIDFSYIQYQRDLSPAFPDADGVSNTLFSDKAMYEHSYPFGPTSRGVRIWEFWYEISHWFERIY